MSDDGMKHLRGALGAAPPQGLRQLDDARLHELAETIDAARRRQAKALADAGEAGIAHLPRVLRGPVRKVLR